MGVNLNKVSERQEKEEQKAAARDVGNIVWHDRMIVGSNPMRLLPPWTDEGPNANDFCREIYQHWGANPQYPNSPLTCPKRTHGLDGDCPVCDKVAQLRATGDAADAEQAAKIQAKVKYLSNAINLLDPVYTQEDYDIAKAAGAPDFEVGDTKIVVWRYTASIYKQILDCFTALQTDITDIESGRDLVVKRTGKGMQDTKYNVILKDASAVDVVGELKLINLDAMSAPKTTAELAAAVGASLPASSPALPASTPTTAPTPQGAEGNTANALEAAMINALGKA